jgi:hypothetical protein
MSEIILRVVFLPILPFVAHPERIAVVASIFLLGHLLALRTGRLRAWPLLAGAITWGLWAAWEWHCNAMEYNIRVDLFLLYPLLFGVTCWALVAPFQVPMHGRAA